MNIKDFMNNGKRRINYPNKSFSIKLIYLFV